MGKDCQCGALCKKIKAMMKIRQISVACPGLFDKMALTFKKQP
jgi:hypothetical protein